ncbi:hypothetical protein QYF36_022162 [Acer negundo]|nr:hypothetical protein QYF36_022162 [Acer negundo]
MEFEEEPTFPSYELAAIATDISNLAWLKSGLENTSVQAIGDAAGKGGAHISLKVSLKFSTLSHMMCWCWEFKDLRNLPKFVISE